MSQKTIHNQSHSARDMVRSSLYKEGKVHEVLGEVHHSMQPEVIHGSKEGNVLPHVNTWGDTEDGVAYAAILGGSHTVATT